MRRQFRGLADLDPCHDPTGLTLARTNYDIRRGQSGLALPWFGKVWLNPPYSDPALWLKLAAWYFHTGQAETLAIVNVSSGSRYWHRWVWPLATAICFLESRVNFLYDGVPENGNRYDQAVIYYGSDLARFWAVWHAEGAIVQPPRPPLTGGSLRANLPLMSTDETLHDQIGEEDTPQYDPMKMLGPAIFFAIYQQVKHMTIEQLVQGTIPHLSDFVTGYQLARAQAAGLADELDEESAEDPEVTFDDPPDPAADFGANGRDFDPPPPTPRKRKRKAKKKAAKKKTAKKAAAKKKPTRKRAAAPPPPPPPAAAGAQTPQTAQLDKHVLGLLQSKNNWTPSRDLKPLVRGVNDNQLRKSLARLVGAGLVVSAGATKSKQYMAA